MKDRGIDRATFDTFRNSDDAIPSIEASEIGHYYWDRLARSMGQHDFYPFVMSRGVLRKLHLIQLIVKDARGGYEIV